MQQRQQMNPAPAPPQRMPAPLPHPSGAAQNMPAPISYAAASVAGVGTHSIFSLSKYRVTRIYFQIFSQQSFSRRGREKEGETPK